MNISGIIVVLMLACLAKILWKVYDTYTIEVRRRDKKEGTETNEPQEPIAIPYNDKSWNIRTNVVEGLKRAISENLEKTEQVQVDTVYEDPKIFLNHGEAHALILPFLQKGYFAYTGKTGYSGDKLIRFYIKKHRDPDVNALEITEELLTKNAQL